MNEKLKDVKKYLYKYGYDMIRLTNGMHLIYYNHYANHKKRKNARNKGYHRRSAGCV